MALLGGAVAGVVGAGLNWFEIPVSPAVQLLPGLVAVLGAALLYGPLGGAIAGGLAGLTTVLLWNHPWAWIGMTLKGTLVGLPGAFDRCGRTRCIGLSASPW